MSVSGSKSALMPRQVLKPVHMEAPILSATTAWNLKEIHSTLVDLFLENALTLNS